MKGMRCDVYQDAAGEWRWRFIATNGRIIADSGEGYSSRYNARRAASTLVENILGVGPELVQAPE